MEISRRKRFSLNAHTAQNVFDSGVIRTFAVDRFRDFSARR